MKPEEIAALAGVAQAVVAFATLLATIAVTVLVYVGTRAIARVEQDRAIREAWNSIDAVALSDASILEIAETLLPGPGGGTRSPSEARRKWFAFMVLNVLSSTYGAASRGLVRSRAESLVTCRYHVGALVKHDDIFALTQEGYSAAFAAFCREVRHEQGQATSPSS